VYRIVVVLERRRLGVRVSGLVFSVCSVAAETGAPGAGGPAHAHTIVRVTACCPHPRGPPCYALCMSLSSSPPCCVPQASSDDLHMLKVLLVCLAYVSCLYVLRPAGFL
jgi:hypothetical protein